MSKKLCDAIGRYLNNKYGMRHIKSIYFQYTLVTTSVDNRREIHVTYQLKNEELGLEECEQCILPIVSKEGTTDKYNSNEFSMHSVVLPKMFEISQDCHIQQFWPESIYSDDNIIVLENMARFQWVNRNKMGFEAAQVVMKKLAHFHATSVAYLREFPNDCVVSQAPPVLAKDGIEKRMQTAIEAVERYWPEFVEIAIKMRTSVESFRERITDVLEKRRCQFKVIALGDLSMQNMIFHEDGELDLLIKNFGDCFVGSCGYDLNFFFNACLSMNELALHRYDLLRTYYEHLSESLECYDHTIPSWQTILDEVRELEFIGFYVLLCEMPFCDEEKDFRKRYVYENSLVKPISFEEEYERALQQDDIKKLLRYGLDRFNELRLWDHNADYNVDKKEKQEDAYGFVIV